MDMLVQNYLFWTVVLLFYCCNIKRVASRTSLSYDAMYACDGKMLKIECKEGAVIDLIRANYGRYSITVCNDHGSTEWSVNCMSHKSFTILKGRCNLKRNCSIQASTSLFGDPCPGTVKYLEAHYSCNSPTASSSTSRPTPPWLMTSQPSVWSTAKSLTLLPDIAVPATPSVTPSTKIVVSSTNQHLEKEEDNNWPINTFPSPSVQVQVPQVTPELEVAVKTTTTTEVHTSTTENVWVVNNVNTPVCKPTVVRNISWNWTNGGDVSAQPCPGGATGIARWRCQTISQNIAIRFPDTPDLSECRSVWLNNLENRIPQGDTLIKVASDLSRVTGEKVLFGGDVITTTKIMRDVAQKMSKDIVTFPDPRQREAVIVDLLQYVVEIGSNLLNTSQQPAWKDLSHKEQMQVATSLLVGLEENSFLLADTLLRGETVTHCLKNIMLSVHVVESKSVKDEIYPLLAEDNCPMRTNNWIQLHHTSLLENSESGLVKVVYITFETLEHILRVQSPGKEERKINSKVLSASLGKGRHIQLTHPATLCLEHLQTENISNPACVFWDYTQNIWSEEGCSILSTNNTHTICKCSHLTSFAIMMDVKMSNAVASSLSIPILIIVAAVLLVVLPIIVLLIVRFIKTRTERKEYGTFVQDNVWFSKCFSCCQSTSDSEKTINCKDQRPALYGNAPQTMNMNINIDNEDITIQPTHIPHTSNTIPRSFINDNGIENHYPTSSHAKLNHNYPTYNRNGSIRKIKEARRLEHIENALQHRNRKLSGTLRSNSPRSHTYSEIVAGASNRGDPVYEEIERDKGHCSQVSDISDEDGKRHSDMSRQSSKSYSDHRPLIPYSAVSDRNFHAALDAAFRQQLKDQSARTVSVLDGETVVCHLQQPDSRIYNKSVNHSLHHY